ncbi:hypothetical protein [Streptomyces sp. NRRL B-1381]|uniref:hypothetical protein n=1 Tax=Streptomyces sp. NRRL B-1381 TaxID=1463829 RepID=UPI001F24CCC3|nr:hypothetical protein [Streptomyces sp. NRRL B-1381]
MEANGVEERADDVTALAAGLLDSVNESLGAPMAPVWEAAFRGVPRHTFLPGAVWVGEDLVECDREAAPVDWLRHAYADTAVVTQVNDGGTAAPGERWLPPPRPPRPSSSACSTCWTCAPATASWRSAPGPGGTRHSSPTASDRAG